MDERTRFEMYYPPFEGAIGAGVGSIMCSYNKVSGVHACASPRILQGHLRRQMAFEGFVVSDWWAVKSSSAAHAGCDMNMPGNNASTSFAGS